MGADATSTSNLHAVELLLPHDTDAANQAAALLVDSFPHDGVHSWTRALGMPADGLANFLRDYTPRCVAEPGLGCLAVRAADASAGLSGVLLLEDFGKPDPPPPPRAEGAAAPPPPSQSQAGPGAPLPASPQSVLSPHDLDRGGRSARSVCAPSRLAAQRPW
jgi:hypothetical protein